MSRLINRDFTPFSQPLLYAVAALICAKIIWIVAGFFMPVLPPAVPVDSGYGAFPDVRHLSGKFFPGADRDTESHASVSLKNIKIKAIYKNGDGGFVIIDDDGKSRFLDYHQRYKGYKLVDLGKKRALFRKNETLYEVTLAGYQREDINDQ